MQTIRLTILLAIVAVPACAHNAEYNAAFISGRSVPVDAGITTRQIPEPATTETHDDHVLVVYQRIWK